MKISKKLKQSHSIWKQEITDCCKKIISNQCDLHFYENLAEYVTALNLHNVV